MHVQGRLILQKGTVSGAQLVVRIAKQLKIFCFSPVDDIVLIDDFKFCYAVRKNLVKICVSNA